MFRTSVSTNALPGIPQKMNLGQYIVDQIVNDFEEYVSKDGFTKLVYTFLQMYYQLTNPKLIDYQKMLETFHRHHYHEFLFQYKDRNKKCTQFIETLKDFTSIKKPKKKDYQTLFASILTFKEVLGTLPGGNVNGIPFVFTAKVVQKWFYDEVTGLRKTLGFDKRKEICMVCGRGHAKESLFYADGEAWSGHTRCAANRIQKCADCPQNIRHRPQNNQHPDADKQMSFTFGVYLIRVGYETRESVKDKWSLDIPEKAVQIVNDWGLFQENAEEIHSVLAEIQATSSKAVEAAVKQFHSGTRPEDCRDHVRKYMVSQYETVCKKLRNENTCLKRKYDQLADSSNECEMMLSLQHRKTKDAYEDNDYLKKRIDSLQSSLIQTERAHDRLKISYQRQQQELQQSIQREWHYYNQQQRFR
jgi:hypothetical protein